MKKFMIFVLALLIAFPCFVFGINVDEFDEETSPALTDILWLTIDPSTAPDDRKITLQNLFGIDIPFAGDNTFSGTNTFNSSVVSDGVTARTGDIVIKLFDNAAANKLSITDSDNVEVAKIDSDGTFTVTNLGTGVAYSTGGELSSTSSLSAGYFSGFTASLPMVSDVNGYATTSATPPIRPLEVDGSTHPGPGSAALTAAYVSNTVITNYGQAASDVHVMFPAAAAGYSALFTVGTAQSNHWGVCADSGDKIYLIGSSGTVTAGTDAECVIMTAAQVGQSFACWTFKTDNYDWLCKAISVGTSTFAAHAHW